MRLREMPMLEINDNKQIPNDTSNGNINNNQ